MIRMYCKVIDDITKRVDVGIGSDYKYYESLGYKLDYVEEGINGCWYLKGYAPQVKPEDWKEKRIEELKKELAKWDYIGVKIATGCATIADYQDIIDMCEQYRKEIRILKGETDA